MRLGVTLERAVDLRLALRKIRVAMHKA